MKRFIGLAVSLAMLVAACSTSDPSTITVYSGRSEDLVQPLIDQFTAETGIRVAVKYAGSADLAATITEEGDNSPADVFLAQDPASLGTVALAELFAVLPTAILDTVPPRFSDRDRKSTRLNSSHTDISRMPSSA